MAEQPGNLIEHHQLRGVADRDHQRVPLLFDGHEVVAEHQLDRNRAQQIVLNLEVLKVNELGLIARGQRFSLRTLLLAAGKWTARKRTAGKWNRN